MFEFGWVVLWYIGSLLLALISFPIAFYFCTKLPDRGFSICRITGFVLAGFITFFLGYLKVPVNFSWPFSLLVLAGCSFWIARKQWAELKAFVHEKRKFLIWLEVVFLVSFVAFCFVRSLTPAISGGEKFMDSGIFNAAQRTEKLPVYDFWISGEPLRYYWFGHLFLGRFSKMLFTPPGFGYNLSIALLFALTVQIMLSLGIALSKKWYWALFGIGYISIFGNLAGAIQIIATHWEKFDFWSPTRVIDGAIAGTINEFPFFTFFFADLHAHLIAIPMVLAIVYLFYQIYQEGATKKNSILTTILLGCIRVTNAWDWPSLVALLGILLFARWWQNGRKEALLKSVVFPWIIITGVSFALFFGFPQPQPLSVKIATLHSKISEWLLVFGAFFFILTAYILSNFKWAGWALLIMLLVTMFALKVWIWLFLFIILLIFILLSTKPDKELSFGILLVITACFILIGMELIYIHDWLANSWQRMNTVFKFGLHSWYLLSMAAPVLLAAAWKNTEHKKLVLSCLLGLLVLAGLVYPTVIIAQRIKWAPEFTLYGFKELYLRHPGDYDGVMWLASHKDNPVIVEAPGDAYNYNGRISSYTGLPTVSGWPGHLFQHGIPWDVIFKRREDVTKIYSSTNIEEAMPLLKHYNVTYVYVGEEERRQFNSSSLEKFNALPKAFESEGVVIYRAG